MSKPIKSGYLSVTETEKDSGEVHYLKPNGSSTVQPIALLRLGLFVPTVRSGSREATGMDASDDLTLHFAEKEGYSDILITGRRLDVETDFKVWMGIVSCLFDYKPNHKGYAVIPFDEFIERCGYPKSRLSKRFRKLIEDSIYRLASTTMKFSRATDDDRINSHILHLIEAGKFSHADDMVHIKPTPELAELYSVDYKKILKVRTLEKLGRKETAKALYLFLEALPENPYPISMQRLKDRLALKSASNVQNSVIRKAMKQLEEIGYLEYTEKKAGHKIEFKIHKRNP
ncbi:TPA: replication initiation protein [Proteus mirabilis]|uniref:Replication initiation protein n=2 Tax=Morganellaceae TaxID=1903414 RepID=A0AAI9HWE3_MORMO|nr:MULTISPECIES: RepB family plasmid replication initiator protein [Providencia]EJV1665075.1 replication initiation protein [Klebsiella pneumoniae]EKW7426993.1 replication initiation protein [Proteus mirabilis]EKW8763406.1 replication initiation protein [Morganella morganii]THB23099.1 RepB family plasmid replication initiator protein [Providencia sp. MGF014]ELI9034621.1 replication initiation protein [Morganella morganii]